MKNLAIFFVLGTLALGCRTAGVEKELDTFVEQYCGAINRIDSVYIKQNTLPFIGVPTALMEIGQIAPIDFRFQEKELKSVAENQWEISIPFIWEGEGNRFVINLIQSDQRFLVSRFALNLNSNALAIYSRSKAQAIPEKVEEGNDFKEDMREAFILSSHLASQYDSVVYFTKSDGEFYFYVINGEYVGPDYEGGATGNFLMGVVNQYNDTIVPIEYDKVYNPHIPVAGYIVAEKYGVQDLFDLSGKKVADTSFTEIYPYYQSNDFIAQVKLDTLYGWLAADGSYGLNPESGFDEDLFRSPLQSELASNLEFSIQTDYSYLNLVTDTTLLTEEHHYYESMNLLVSPGYLVKLGLMKEYTWNVFGHYYGPNEYNVTFEGIKKLWNNLVLLIVDFKEYGLDARGYHYQASKYIIADTDFNTRSETEFSVGENYGEMGSNEVRFVNDSILEYRTRLYQGSSDFDYYVGYKYYQLDSSGTLAEVECNRSYAFTKYVEINEAYFAGGYKFLSEESYMYNALSYPYLSVEALDIMRNEIFADYGYIFKDEEWANYFAQMSWYNPQYEDVSAMLSETDRYNINQILKFKAALSKLNIEPDSIQYYEGP